MLLSASHSTHPQQVTVDEDLGQADVRRAPEPLLEVVAVGGAHEDVALVHAHGEVAQDLAHGGAARLGGAHDTEAGHVHHALPVLSVGDYLQGQK